MDKKKDVHKTGALGAILNQGLLKPIDINSINSSNNYSPLIKKNNYLFDTELTLSDAALINVDPSECIPWQFANRSDEEFGDIEALANSLKTEGQQEPILVRTISNNLQVNDSIKYEIIFGRRRWKAASLINLTLLAIRKELSNQEAAVAQKAENKHRLPVSPYSEAIHYKTLLLHRCFTTEHELAQKLQIPKSTLYDLMSFTKIPETIINSLPNVHQISVNLAVTICSILNKNPEHLSILLDLAPKIGTGITSAKMLKEEVTRLIKKETVSKPKSINVMGENGTHLFTIKHDSNGAPCIVLQKHTRNIVNLEELSAYLKNFIEQKFEKLDGIDS